MARRRRWQWCGGLALWAAALVGGAAAFSRVGWAAGLRVRPARGLDAQPTFVDISPNRDGSVLKRTLVAGNPRLGHPARHDDVTISWRMFSLNRTLLHDSLELEKTDGQLFEFKLGMVPSEVISGWEVALGTMFVGELAELQLEPPQAFGAQGLPGLVPPDTSLLCELRLHGVAPFVTRTHPVEREDRAEQVHAEVIEGLRGGALSLDLPLQRGDDFVIDTEQVQCAPSQPLPPPPPARGFMPVGPLPPPPPPSTPQGPPQKMFDPAQQNEDPQLVVGGEGAGHRWEETQLALEVRVPLPSDATKRDLLVDLRADFVSVRVGKHVLLEGPLQGRVLASLAAWMVEEVAWPRGGRELVLVLDKAHSSRRIWASVLSTEHLRRQQQPPAEK